MTKNKIDNSNNRKEKFLEMFLLINSSIYELKNILVYDFEELKIKKTKEIIPFQDDLSSNSL